MLIGTGKLYGYNTDAPAFLKVIEKFDVKKILFLGAGGTAQSSAKILRNHNYSVTIANRSKGRLEFFKSDGFNVTTYDKLEPNGYELVVNMSSVGLNDDSLPVSKEWILDCLRMPKGWLG